MLHFIYQLRITGCLLAAVHQYNSEQGFGLVGVLSHDGMRQK